MGNVFSSDSARGDHVISDSEREVNNMASSSEDSSENQEFHDAIDEASDRENRIIARESEMEKFRQQLEIKREQRRVILDRHKSEKKELEISLENERKAKLEAIESNKALRDLLLQNSIEIPEHLQSSKENSDITESIIRMQEEFEKIKSSNNKLRRDLAEANAALQGANSDIADLQFNHTQSITQINALKEVVAVSKTMLRLRENQLDELKEKLSEIERSLADRETNMLSANLRQEYERQLQNIRSLRTLYEERARLAEATRQGLLRELEEQKRLKQVEIEKVSELTAKVNTLESKVDELQEMVSNKNNQIYTCQDETRGLKAEMSAVNKLFSQVLLGYKNRHDLDKLVHRLEENHGILTHMAENENDSEASTALPKLLLEIVSQVDEEDSDNSGGPSGTKNVESGEKVQQDTESQNNATAEEIVHNLPKVWRVLIELLSHQAAPSDENEAEKVTTCYKTVETNSGPVQVPSVSQTYIRLKDLIIEKLGLVKEVNRMKQLNTHLETRLEEQERKLCLVTSELSKTWHVVGRLRRHHHQLHTHEKILKYELQQKRKLLTELKEELEYCREKWDQAREKNTQSEKDWRKLRAEFSSRNTQSSILFNNSGESGYSDEKPSDESSESNDESEYVQEPLIRCKKKIKKSFETILDSSTDRNLAAEREDPASDMLDVADLPLDTQEGEDHHDVSDSCNSESLIKSEKVCETEDEVGDIANDSCTEDTSAADISHKSDKKLIQDKSVISPASSSDVVVIDPAAIMRSIREQTERLAKKDKKLEMLEKDGASLLQKTKATANLGHQINATLDHLLNRPSSSKDLEQETQPVLEISLNENDTIDLGKIANTANKFVSEEHASSSNSDKTSDSQLKMLDVEPLCVNHDKNDPICAMPDDKKILVNESTAENGNINEPLDCDIQRLSNNLDLVEENSVEKVVPIETSEAGCSKITQIEDNASNTSKALSEKDHEDSTKESADSSNRDSSEPSTSSEVDHEALFAARDLRLKRLEEQTKSLVSRVNKTTDKGVKIHYKLEELHNIYGSENSRAGTPSDNEERDRCSDDTEKQQPDDDISQGNEAEGTE
ncbi:myosin heavy chain, cardiac muscle isoform [Phthorimaea operculella]|nr:myosin heavy chain, cardiac muscle isoform [Phthorimaea operculella]